MFLLEQTTLFYHNLAFRSFDKSSTGLVNNWVAQIPAKGYGKFRRKESVHTNSSGDALSSTVVSSERPKRPAPIQLFLYTGKESDTVDKGPGVKAKFQIKDCSSDVEWLYDDEINPSNLVSYRAKL
jgi:hypothetical protein